MNLDLDKWIAKGEKVASAVQKSAGELAHKGKTQLDLVAAQNKLNKAQRQLGALVYSLARNGEENQPLVDKYIEAVAEVEAELEMLRREAEDITEEAEEAAVEEAEEAEEHTCPGCGAEVADGARFCSQCGKEL